jgi:hypothetical protein
MPKSNLCSITSTRQFSTTKPLISKEVKNFNSDSESIIIVNSTVNNLKFVSNKSILLLPFNLKNRLKFETSFINVCSNLERGKYTFEFYLHVKSDFLKNFPVYFRKNNEKFVRGLRLTDGYIRVCSFNDSSSGIDALCELYYVISNQYKPPIYIIKENQKVLLIIKAEEKPAPAAEMIAVAVDYSELKRAVAYGSSVTKSSSASYKIDSTACAS